VNSSNVCLPGNVLCDPSVSVDHRKRDIEWPATAIGSRRLVRCPYAYDQASYAHRDCILSSIIDQTPRWTAANVTMCPQPPFSQGVDRLADFMVRSKRSLPSVVLFSESYSLSAKLNAGRLLSRFLFCETALGAIFFFILLLLLLLYSFTETVLGTTLLISQGRHRRYTTVCEKPRDAILRRTKYYSEVRFS